MEKVLIIDLALDVSLGFDADLGINIDIFIDINIPKYIGKNKELVEDNCLYL